MITVANILAACGVVYGVLAVLILVRLQSQFLLALCCGMTALWAGIGFVQGGSSLVGVPGAIDFARLLSWFVYLLAFYKRLDDGALRQMRGFAAVAIIGACLEALDLVFPGQAGSQGLTVLSLPIASRLLVLVCELLLIENLYLNLPERARWHVVIPAVVLGGLACIDILIVAETVLYRQGPASLDGARATTMIVLAPLFYAAATRGKRWTMRVRLSRTAVFHSATLILSGSVLLCLAVAGEVLRAFTPALGWVAEFSLVFAGFVGIVLFVLSRSGKSLVDRRLVHPFFADEYDYRRQWLNCIDTLSGTSSIERTTLHARAIKVMADAVDSPAGVLFLRDGTQGAMHWAGSWNMPGTTTLPADHPVVQNTRDGETILTLSEKPAPELSDPLHGLGRVWLAVPLLHSLGVIGVVVVGPPRIAFKPSAEVFGILRILGREVATYINEQMTAEAMRQARDLRDYSKRFAFVAHDIKNVSSQLAMLLQNAEHHISNPEFQDDMLATVRSSVGKITALLKRLEDPQISSNPSSIVAVSRVEDLVTTYKRVRKANLSLEHDGSTGQVVINPDAFDTAFTHLLNNAVEASAGAAVVVKVHHEASRITVAICDRGPGMTAEFVRDRLFRPFETGKKDGSGIGAFQARELLREAGADLQVSSEPGAGTTMQIILTRADQPVTSARSEPRDVAEIAHGR